MTQFNWIYDTSLQGNRELLSSHLIFEILVLSKCEIVLCNTFLKELCQVNVQFEKCSQMGIIFILNIGQSGRQITVTTEQNIQLVRQVSEINS